MQSSRPLAVIVSGAPGSGKTTLAIRLSRDTGCVLLCKDAFKEMLADEEGWPESVAASRAIGARAYSMLFDEAMQCLDRGRGVVIESNFRRASSEPELLAALGEADVRSVHCAAAPASIEHRYLWRTDRHPVHLDAARVADVVAEIADGRYEPLELEVPLLEIRTDAGYRPSYDTILAFVANADERSVR